MYGEFQKVVPSTRFKDVESKIVIGETSSSYETPLLDVDEEYHPA